jgi:hypothetical protein
VLLCDESDTGFGWISPAPDWMARASHALAADGRVWLIDPVDFGGLDDRVRLLGDPAGVLQLLGWHHRDSAAIAARLGVAHLITPDAVPDSPFETTRIAGIRGWRETALWWPEERTLIVAEAVGTVRYYCAPGRPLGIHPFFRVFRPPSALLRFEPDHILCGHGPGLHADAAKTLRDTVDRARRDLPVVLPRIAAARRHPQRAPS